MSLRCRVKSEKIKKQIIVLIPLLLINFSRKTKKLNYNSHPVLLLINFISLFPSIFNPVSAFFHKLSAVVNFLKYWQLPDCSLRTVKCLFFSSATVSAPHFIGEHDYVIVVKFPKVGEYHQIPLRYVIFPLSYHQYQLSVIFLKN